jgi:hypothetical protein
VQALENGQADIARASAKREIRVENRPKEKISAIVAAVRSQNESAACGDFREGVAAPA